MPGSRGPIKSLKERASSLEGDIYWLEKFRPDEWDMGVNEIRARTILGMKEELRQVIEAIACLKSKGFEDVE